MKEKLIAYYLGKKLACMERLENFGKEEQGASDIVAILLVIVILIAVAAVFKDNLLRLVNDVFGKLFESIG